MTISVSARRFVASPFAFFVAAFAPLLARAESNNAATLRVRPESVLASVNPNVVGGYNFGLWMQVIDFRDDLLAVVPKTLRFPAGNMGDDQDLSQHALDALAANVHLLRDPALVMQTRVFQSRTAEPARNRPEDAAAAALMARERGLRVNYWEIGNEPDLYATMRADPSWTAQRYCEVFRAHKAAIRAVVPEALFAGPGVSGSLATRDKFLADFVACCGDAVDLLTWHIYPSDGTLSDDDALDTVSEADRTVSQFQQLWRDASTNPLGYKRQVPLGVTEYGLSWQSSRQRHLADIVASIWTLETALRLNEQGVAVAHYFALQATGGHGVLDTGGGRRPSFYAFALASKLRGKLVRAESSNAQLWAHAALDGQTLQIVVINRSAKPIALDTNLDGYLLNAGEQFDEGITRQEAPPRQLARAQQLPLPGQSVTLLRYTGK